MEQLLLPLLLIAALALPLILGSRRQKQAAAQAAKLQESLTEGDRVMTSSGLHATVVDTTDDRTVDLEIAPGVRTTWVRAAIREKLTEDEPEDEIDGAEAQLAPPREEHARTDRP